MSSSKIEPFFEYNAQKFYRVGSREGLARYWFSVSVTGAKSGQIKTDRQFADQFRIDVLAERVAPEYKPQLRSGEIEAHLDVCKKIIMAAINSGFEIRRICGKEG